MDIRLPWICSRKATVGHNRLTCHSLSVPRVDRTWAEQPRWIRPVRPLRFHVCSRTFGKSARVHDACCVLGTDTLTATVSVPSDVSIKSSGACAGHTTPVNTSTLDTLLAEYSGQQEEINPSCISSNSLNDFPNSYGPPNAPVADCDRVYLVRKYLT